MSKIELKGRPYNGCTYLMEQFVHEVLHLAMQFKVPAEDIIFMSNFSIQCKNGSLEGVPYLIKAAQIIGFRLTWMLSGLDPEDFKNPYPIL